MLVTDLPEPDSPTMPRGLAALDVEGEPVDGLHQAVVGREVHLEVADLEEAVRRRLGSQGAHLDLTLGSITA
jgi:hypothetical protein